MATALGINYADIILNEDIKKKKTFTKSLDISINEIIVNLKKLFPNWDEEKINSISKFVFSAENDKIILNNFISNIELIRKNKIKTPNGEKFIYPNSDRFINFLNMSLDSTTLIYNFYKNYNWLKNINENYISDDSYLFSEKQIYNNNYISQFTILAPQLVKYNNYLLGKNYIYSKNNKIHPFVNQIYGQLNDFDINYKIQDKQSLIPIEDIYIKPWSELKFTKFKSSIFAESDKFKTIINKKNLNINDIFLSENNGELLISYLFNDSIENIQNINRYLNYWNFFKNKIHSEIENKKLIKKILYIFVIDILSPERIIELNKLFDKKKINLKEFLTKNEIKKLKDILKIYKNNHEISKNQECGNYLSFRNNITPSNVKHKFNKIWKSLKGKLMLNENYQYEILDINCSGLKIMCRHEKDLYIDKKSMSEIINDYGVENNDSINCKYCGLKLLTKLMKSVEEYDDNNQLITYEITDENKIININFLFSILFMIENLITKHIGFSARYAFNKISKYVSKKHSEISMSKNYSALEIDYIANYYSVMFVSAFFIKLIMKKLIKLERLGNIKTEKDLITFFLKVMRPRLGFIEDNDFIKDLKLTLKLIPDFEIALLNSEKSKSIYSETEQYNNTINFFNKIKLIKEGPLNLAKNELLKQNDFINNIDKLDITKIYAFYSEDRAQPKHIFNFKNYKDYKFHFKPKKQYDTSFYNSNTFCSKTKKPCIIDYVIILEQKIIFKIYQSIIKSISEYKGIEMEIIYGYLAKNNNIKLSINEFLSVPKYYCEICNTEIHFDKFNLDIKIKDDSIFSEEKITLNSKDVEEINMKTKKIMENIKSIKINIISDLDLKICSDFLGSNKKWNMNISQITNFLINIGGMKDFISYQRLKYYFYLTIFSAYQISEKKVLNANTEKIINDFNIEISKKYLYYKDINISLKILLISLLANLINESKNPNEKLILYDTFFNIRNNEILYDNISLSDFKNLKSRIEENLVNFNAIKNKIVSNPTGKNITEGLDKFTEELNENMVVENAGLIIQTEPEQNIKTKEEIDDELMNNDDGADDNEPEN